MTGPGSDKISAPHAEAVLPLLDGGGVGLATSDRQGVLTWWNDAFSQLLTIDPNDIPSDTPWFLNDASTAEEKKDRLAQWSAFLGSNGPWQGPVHWRPLGRPSRFLDVTASQEGEHILYLLRDRTDYIAERRTARQLTERQRQIVDALPLAIATIDPKGRVEYANPYLASRLQADIEDLMGQRIPKVGANKAILKLAAIVRKVMMTNSAVDGGLLNVTQGILRDTNWLVFGQPINDNRGQVSAVLLIGIDRTERVRISRERSQFAEAIAAAQQSAMLNDFAGGLAHELGNLLHPIAAYARFIERADNQATARDFASKINKAALTAGSIIRRTLTMSEPQAGDTEPARLRDVLDETLQMARDVAPQSLTYQQKGDPGTVRVECAASGVQQILLNVLNNASEALGYQGDVILRIETGLARPKDIEPMPTGTPPFVRIDVIDHGGGIDPAIRSHIFEPFFSTKTGERGLGLGLPLVQGVVLGAGGTVAVASDDGSGTTVSIWLPHASEEP